MSEISQEDELLRESLYDVSASIHQIERWPLVKRGYIDLTMYLAFFVLFIATVLMQTDVTRGYQLSYALREGVVMQSGQVDTIKTQNDWWKYLMGSSGQSAYEQLTQGPPPPGEDPQPNQEFPEADLGFLLRCFNEIGYNTQTVGSDQLSYVLMRNKLIGGVLFLQHRLKPKACGSAYESFAYDCMSTEYDTSPYGPQHNTSLYEYDKEAGGYSCFFGNSNGMAANFKKLTDLALGIWTDKYTDSVYIKMAFYNGVGGVFTYVSMRFAFGSTGVLIPPHMISIESVDFEPYDRPLDALRLGLEIVLLFWIGFNIGVSVIDAWRHTPWGGDKHQTLWVYLSRFWNALDWVNNILFIASIFFRIQLLFLVVDQAPVVPTNTFNYAIEEAATLSLNQLIINSFNIFLSTLKIFKYFEFQDRLNVLTRTIATAWTDLYHFLVMFIVIFVGFGIIGYLIFGTALQTYSTIGNCLQATFELVIGNYDLQSIMRIDIVLSLVYFYVFVFLVSIVLLNVLLAILMGAYSEAAKPADGFPFATVGSEVSMSVRRMFAALNHRKGLHRDLSDSELVAVLEYFRKAGVLFVSKNDILARLDADMGAQLDNMLPILVEVESIEGRYIDNQFKDRDDVIKKALSDRLLRHQSTQALLDNRELKQKLSNLLKEEAERKQRVRARRVVEMRDENKFFPK